MTDILKAAKEIAETEAESPGRKWLTTEVSVYGGDHYKTVLHVLEGTPPRAYVIENRHRNFCVVIGMDGQYMGTVEGVMPHNWVNDGVRIVNRSDAEVFAEEDE